MVTEKIAFIREFASFVIGCEVFADVSVCRTDTVKLETAATASGDSVACMSVDGAIICVRYDTYLGFHLCEVRDLLCQLLGKFFVKLCYGSIVLDAKGFEFSFDLQSLSQWYKKCLYILVWEYLDCLTLCDCFSAKVWEVGAASECEDSFLDAVMPEFLECLSLAIRTGTNGLVRFVFCFVGHTLFLPALNSRSLVSLPVAR